MQIKKFLKIIKKSTKYQQIKDSKKPNKTMLYPTSPELKCTYSLSWNGKKCNSATTLTETEWPVVEHFLY